MEKKFGRLPIYKGDWTDGIVAEEKWRYTYKGSEFQSLINDNILPPLDENGDLNTGWKLISRGIEALDEVPIPGSKNPVESGALYEAFKEVSDKIDSLAAGVKIAIAVSPTVIYKNIATNVTLTGTMSNGVPSKMQLFDSADPEHPLKTTESSPIVHTIENLVLNTNSKSYAVKGVVNGLELNSSVNLNARYPIKYGFGANAAAVEINDSNKYEPTTTAAHTYEKTAQADGVYFFILVPSDISGLSRFTMGGAPFVMETLEPQTMHDIVYKVYRSGNTYNSGTKLTVVAS